MTREEAIKLIGTLDYYLYHNLPDYTTKENTALLTAIKALKQPEIIHCKDCKYKNDEYECPFYNMGYHCEDYSYCSYAEGKECL